MLSQRRIFAIFKKEVRHIIRDPFTLIIALILPVIMVLMFGTAIEFNVREVPTAYLDQDKTQASRSFLDTLSSSRYFKIRPVTSPHDGFQLMERELVHALVIIPPEFEKNLLGKNEGKIQVLLDGTDNSSVGALSGYLGAIQQKVIQNIYPNSNVNAPAVKLSSRFLFNPELNSQWFIVPALTAVIMAILSIMLTALTISREWENGSMELLLSTPVHSSEIILGKIMPYAGLGILAVIMVYIIARTLYGLPFVGSLWIFWFGTILFLLTYLGLGLLISTLIRNQQAAVQVALTLGLLPSVLFSGFIFPLEHMPVGFQYFSSIFPARWYVDIVRDQFLKGSSFGDLWLQFSILLSAAYFVIQLCIVKFKGNLEP